MTSDPGGLIKIAPRKSVAVGLPAALWWAVPLAVQTAWLWRCQPRGWWAVAVVAALAYPRSLEVWMVGNSDLWSSAAVAAGIWLRWPAVLVLVKPTFFVFALVGAQRRSWWIALGVMAMLAVPFGALWIDWLTVVHNVAGSAGYLVHGLPMMLLPVVAWLGRSHRVPERRRDRRPAAAS